MLLPLSRASDLALDEDIDLYGSLMKEGEQAPSTATYKLTLTDIIINLAPLTGITAVSSAALSQPLPSLTLFSFKTYHFFSF